MTLSRVLLVLLLALPAAPGWSQETEKNPDPFESVNRAVFAFNDVMDRWLIRPVAKGYDWITPDPLQRGIGNFYANLYDFNSAINGVLQWRWGGTLQSGGRFLVNSTLGLAGFFDVATRMGIRPYRTDFGHTLAIWGVDSGPYLMIPFFGPRPVRSGAGTLFDLYTSVPYLYVDNEVARWTIWGMELIDGRARLLETDELVTGDRYIFIRDVYLQNRAMIVNDGVVEDTFSDFGDEEEWEEF